MAFTSQELQAWGPGNLHCRASWHLHQRTHPMPTWGMGSSALQGTQGLVLLFLHVPKPSSSGQRQCVGHLHSKSDCRQGVWC